MDTHLRELLDELSQFGKQNDADQADHKKKMLNLYPDAAQLISVLIRSGKCQRLLEIGTSNGYSTIWLAWAAQATGGRVISIEREPEKQGMADSNLKRAGLRDRVDLMLGDATEIVASLGGRFDFVFFDADRLSAPEQLDLLLPRLEDGALVLADNVHSHPEEMEPYLEAISSLSTFDHMIIPVGLGLSLAYKQSQAR